MLMSDHGGRAFNYDSFDISTIQVPFAMWGAGVEPHAHIAFESTLTQQVGPTLLTVLNYTDDIPDDWLASPIEHLDFSSPNGVTYNRSYFTEPERFDSHDCLVPKSVAHIGIKWAMISLEVMIVGLVMGGWGVWEITHPSHLF